MSGIHPFLHSADRHIIHSSNRAPIIRPLFPPEQQCPLPFRPFHPGLPSGVGLDLGIVRVAPYGPVLRLLFHPAAEPQALVVEDGNVITAVGMFFREFAEAVLRRFGYDIGKEFMRDKPEDFTEEELTFYWSDEEYQEFLEELKAYTG